MMARRFRHLVLGWGSVGLVYGLCAMLQGPGKVVPETALDRAIAFTTSGIWLYMSFFLLVPAAFFLTSPARLLWLQRAFQVSALFSGSIFLMWPTTLHYPELEDASLPAHLQGVLVVLDSNQNCLPSLHGALTLLSVWALSDRHRLLRSGMAALWGIAILYATVQIRRHVFIDLAAGLTTGLLAGVAVHQRRHPWTRFTPRTPPS